MLGTDVKDLGNGRSRLDVGASALGCGDADVALETVQYDHPGGIHRGRAVIDLKADREVVDGMIDPRGYRGGIQLEGRIVPNFLGDGIESNDLIVLDPRGNDVKDPADRGSRMITGIAHLHGRNGSGSRPQHGYVVSYNHCNGWIGGDVTDW